MKPNLDKLANLLEQIKSLSLVISEDITNLNNNQRLLEEKRQLVKKQEIDLHNNEAQVNKAKDELFHQVKEFEKEKVRVKEKELFLKGLEEGALERQKDLDEREKKIGDQEAIKKGLDKRDEIIAVRKKDIDDREQRIVREIAVDAQRKEILRLKEEKVARKMKQLQLESEI